MTAEHVGEPRPASAMDMSPITAEEVELALFTHRGLFGGRWGGYDETEVDALLDRVWWTLKRVESTATLLEAQLLLAERGATKAVMSEHIEQAKEAVSWLTTK